MRVLALQRYTCCSAHALHRWWTKAIILRRMLLFDAGVYFHSHWASRIYRSRNILWGHFLSGGCVGWLMFLLGVLQRRCCKASLFTVVKVSAAIVTLCGMIDFLFCYRFAQNIIAGRHWWLCAKIKKNLLYLGMFKVSRSAALSQYLKWLMCVQFSYGWTAEIIIIILNSQTCSSQKIGV